MEETKTYLPEEMLVKIMIHLPVKNLIRYRCVCKAWYQIIGSDTFIKSTISNTSSNRMYLLSSHNQHYTLRSKEKTASRKLSYYRPNLFGLMKEYDKVKVFGCCNGLLCVADNELHTSSSIYLLNPVILKDKKIPLKVCEPGRDADLCFGYFQDDYKVTTIAAFSGDYRVDVYSLSTDSWKTIICHSNYATSDCTEGLLSKYVSGVAYFLKYRGRIVCFNFRDETIREVELPEKVQPIISCYSISLEAYEESLALVARSSLYKHNVAMWVLRNCGATNTFTWEMKFKLKVQHRICLDPAGFTMKGSYLLTSDLGARVYLSDPGMSELQECRCNLDTRCLLSIDYLVGNLVLLNEKTLHPFVEKKRCSTQNTLILYKGQRPTDKGRKRKFNVADIKMRSSPNVPYYPNVFEF